MKMVENEKPEGLMTANPYNKKAVDDSAERGVPGANDSLAYTKQKKEAVFDPVKNEEPVQEEPKAEAADEMEEDSKASPYKRVDWKDRYDNLKRHDDKKLNEWREERKKIEQELKEGRPKYTPPKTAEELEQFKKEYPDIYGVVETVAHMKSNSEAEQLKQELQSIQEKLSYEEAKAAYNELKAMVPDYEEIRQSDDFHSWAESQPEEIQNWVYKNRTNATLAAKAINLYKADRGIGSKPPAQTPEVRTVGADEAVSVKSAREEPTPKEQIFTTSQIARMSLDDYERNKDAIDRAYLEGRVVKG